MAETDAAGSVPPAPNGSESWLKSMIVPIVVSLLGGGIVGSFLTFTIDRTKAQNEYTTQFSKSINESLPQLTDDRQSAISFESLLNFAQTDDQKRTVIRIGIDANTAEIRYTLASVVSTNKDIARITHEASMKKVIISTIARLSGGRSASNVPHGILMNAPDESSVALIDALTQVQDGYILLEAGRFEQHPHPLHGFIYALDKPRFVRDAWSDRSGDVVGALDAGAKVTVQRFSVQYEDGRPYTWAAVRVIDKAARKRPRAASP